jgi:hypothetical protein
MSNDSEFTITIIHAITGIVSFTSAVDALYTHKISHVPVVYYYLFGITPTQFIVEK